MADIDVAIVVSPRDWAERLHRFLADHGGARVRARVLDAREALDEGYAVLVAEDLTSFLTPRLLHELRQQGKRVLGIHEPAEPWGRERLAELGVDDVLAATEPPEVVLDAIRALAGSRDLDAELLLLAEPRPPELPAERPLRAGRVTAVGGPAGGPGATEVAIGLALAGRTLGITTVLVDADEVAPSIAQRLGLPLHPNLRTAIDVVQHRSGPLEDAFVSGPRGLEVVAGLAGAEDWSQLRPGEVLDVVAELARARRHVVVNVGHRIEDLGGTLAPGRYGLTRAVLGAADTVLAVGSHTPVGVTRLLEWIAGVRAMTGAPLHVAVNRVPPGQFVRAEIGAEVSAGCDPAGLAFLPGDRRVEAAAWNGEAVTSGPFWRALTDLASDLLHQRPAPSWTARTAHARTVEQRGGRPRGQAVR